MQFLRNELKNSLATSYLLFNIPLQPKDRVPAHTALHRIRCNDDLTRCQLKTECCKKGQFMHAGPHIKYLIPFAAIYGPVYNNNCCGLNRYK